ncbi:hypothetical protein [Salimicrobium flavidum]|uniref:hypothetical protein n=1 Tax=Salimicrobium flavidum TaxID=570947 RepID=UPI001F33B384|nr:hypothetical protein [Salimicrobium flavidum]
MTGYIIIILGIILSFVSIEITMVMGVVTIFYGSLLSALAVLLEEWTYHKYPDVKSILKLYLWALTESFWYRPLLVWWRFEGLWMFLTRRKSSWGDMNRKGVAGVERQQS